MLKQVLIRNSPSPNLRYIDRYISYIEGCKNKIFKGRTEGHHILPKSFGGKNGNNILRMSSRHHYIAHVLLAKATGSPKMIKALHKMVYSRTGDVSRSYRISSRMYEYLRTEHSRIVSAYSKDTVTAKNLITGEIKRVPKHLFNTYKGELYEGVAKGRKDSAETIKIKRIVSSRPRVVKQGAKIRSISASKYLYITPKGYCETSKDLLKLYTTFTKNTLLLLNDDFVISDKFASIHTEFQNHIGKKLKDIGFTRKLR